MNPCLSRWAPGRVIMCLCRVLFLKCEIFSLLRWLGKATSPTEAFHVRLSNRKPDEPHTTVEIFSLTLS